MKNRSIISFKKQIIGFCFVLPSIIGLIAFFIVPLFSSLAYSFSDVKLTENGMSTTLIGFSNYSNALTKNAQFLPKLTQSILNMIINAPIVVIFSFFAATLLNQQFKGNKIARIIFLLPIVMASTALMNLDTWDVFQGGMRSGGYRAVDAASAVENFNLSEFLILYSGLPEGFITFLSDAVGRVYEIVRMSGVQILIIFTGLQSISPSLYEASNVEGATAWENFWLITFQMVSPVLLLSLIYSIIDSFTAFNNWVLVLIDDTMFQYQQFGLASSMAWIYFVIIAFILLVVAFISRKGVYYGDN